MIKSNKIKIYYLYLAVSSNNNKIKGIFIISAKKCVPHENLMKNCAFLSRHKMNIRFTRCLVICPYLS